MRVLVCPTAFKESLGPAAVAQAMATGVLRAVPEAEVTILPVSDGGPGLLDAVRSAGGGRRETVPARDPWGERRKAECLRLSGGEVLIEAAEANGLHLVPLSRRDPLRTDTRGVGDLIQACVENGGDTVWVGLGGSGTVDGGSGMATVFGYRFLDARGRELSPGGGSLEALARIEPGWRPVARITGLADVRSPLLGPDGAALRFAPQKGARPAEVERLERGLARLAECMESDLGVRVAELAGAGAAGGLGAGLAGFLGAELQPGAAWVLDRVGLDQALITPDLVITGEGSWDPTGDLGKVVPEVIARASKSRVPVLLVCGRIVAAVPQGVRGVGGEGRWLDGADIADLVASALG